METKETSSEETEKKFANLALSLWYKVHVILI